jgi:hypothetical protein
MQKYFTYFFRILFLGYFLKTVIPVQAQSQSWLPYFGNTHFGYSTGSIINGRTPTAVAMADLDADGDPDAVISKGGLTSLNSGFVVLLNLGNGYYSAPTHYATGQACQDILVADFNNDTIPDVAVSNTGFAPYNSSISIFSGLGGGSFGAAISYNVGTGPTGLAASDFNSDGKIDLAVTNYNGGQGNTVSILYNGTAGFNASVAINTASAPFKLAVGRIDQDNYPDLVIAHDNQKLSVLHNTGTSFIPDSVYQVLTTNYAGDGNPSVVLTDIDQDQDLDVLYSSTRTWDGSTGLIALRKNNGNGKLTAVQQLPLNPYSSGTPDFKAADLNGDQLPDLIAASPSGRSGDGYVVLMNQGAGTFAPAVVRPGGQNTSLVAVADVNMDLYQDVLSIDTYSLELTVHQNPGTGQFVTPTLHTNGIAGLAGTLEVADLDNDGDLDIVTSSDTRAAVPVPVVLVRNQGGGTFAPGVTIATAGVQAKLRDLTNDGLPDLLYIGGTGSTGYNFLTAINLGNGNFATPQLHNVGVCAPEDIDAADLDGDGDLDVVATGGCSSAIHVSYNQGNAIFTSSIALQLSAYPGPLALGDFNKDGKIDIAAGTISEIAILLANPVSGFLAPVYFAMDNGPYDILTVDLNDDGNLDIASCNYGASSGDYNMTVRLGNGTGGFGQVQLLPAAYSPDLANVSGITCGDIDNDLDLDLMVSNNATNDMSVYLNQGNGVFSAGMRSGLYYSARSPWFADFNNDGHCEVAALVSLPPGGFQSAIAILNGTNSGYRTANTSVILGSPENKKASSFNLKAFPNPFRESTDLKFTLGRNSTVSLKVYNILGKEITSPLENRLLPPGEHLVRIPTGSLAKGLYFIQLNSNTGSQTLRLVAE